MREMEYDIVIIGSGAGGGVAAQELAPLCADGKRIAVLEWGAKLEDDEFTGREVDMASKLFFDSGGTFTEDRAMTLAYGRAYGGSTVIYTGTSLTMPKEVVKQWNVPGLEFTDLHRRSMKYFEENNVHLLPDDEINDNNRLFLKGCQELGYNVEQFPINVKGCRGSSLCNLGCPNQAKQGTDRVQLPKAESQGVEVITNCRVTKIGDHFCEAVVADPGYGEPSKWEPGEYRVRAKVVVVCAGGVVNSPGLLLHHQLSRFPQKLLLRSIHEEGQVPPRDLHVLSLCHRQEPDRLRSRTLRADARLSEAADDPGAGAGSGSPGESGHPRRAQRSGDRLHAHRTGPQQSARIDGGEHKGLLRRRRQTGARSGRNEFLY
ncbi:MAG: GMC family oxidoreductase N-terminal domain-containing protein [Acidobacteria bacterium]|nr:GMC family oxidoreductase N-terminal domain-containing protein [Candidatus Sulfomarinibacter kjeldsenii]